MAHNNPYAVPIQPPRYAPGTQFTVSGRNREDQQKSDAAIKLHIDKNNKIIAAGKHASPHAQEARRAAWNAHDAASRIDKNNKIKAAGKHASPHAQEARRAAGNAHDAASKEAQKWATIRAEQQEMREELELLEAQVARLRLQKNQ